MNEQEDAESRLQRLKMETAEIKQHNEKLENVCDKPAAETVTESEVSSVIKITWIYSGYACAHSAWLRMYNVTLSGSWPVSVCVVVTVSQMYYVSLFDSNVCNPNVKIF